MYIKNLLIIIVTLFILSGCGTTQDVMLVKASNAIYINTVMQKPEKGNSPEMDNNLALALQKESVSLKGQVLDGVQKADGVDAVVSYIDVWNWDIAMYLKSISIRMYDAKTGDLLVLGNWADSPLHGFRDSRLVVEGLVKEMVAKLRPKTASK